MLDMDIFCAGHYAIVWTSCPEAVAEHCGLNSAYGEQQVTLVLACMKPWGST